MRNVRRVVLVFALSATAATFADDLSDVEKKKLKAENLCVVEAKERYGAAEAITKPRKKKIGRVKGYALKIKVGAARKTVNCLVGKDGEFVFYQGKV